MQKSPAFIVCSLEVGLNGFSYRVVGSRCSDTKLEGQERKIMHNTFPITFSTTPLKLQWPQIRCFGYAD